jgi:hypothetical protein
MPTTAFVLAQAAGNAAAAMTGLACLLVAALIGALIGAVIIRAAVWLANKIVAGAIPDPNFGRAYLMALAAFVVNVVVSVIVQMVLRAGDPQTAQIVSALVGLPIGFFVLAAVATTMLPTTFGRACLVAVFYYVVCIVIGAIIALIFVVLGASMFALQRG